MDQRQAQIRERAGLEESRLNEDFIEFLRTYGVWILLLVALAGGGTTAKRWWDTQQAQKVDQAFEEFEAVRAGADGASPESVAAVAQTVGSTRSVGILARLEAADLYLSAVRRGVKAGAKIDAEGKLENADDLLTPDVRKEYLAKASDLYTQVAAEAGTDPARRVFAVGATFGLAAIAECERDFAKAKTLYAQIEQMTAGTTLAMQGTIAKDRAASIDSLANVPALLPKAELPTIAEAEPAPAAMPSTMNLEPVKIEPGATPESTLAQPVAPQPVVPPAEPAAPK